MILRIWRGAATPANAAAYERHIAESVFPALAAIPGQRGATLVRREAGGLVEFLALTRWESMAAVRAFAGDDPGVAVVEPAARAVLAEFDDFALHYEIAHDIAP